MTASGTRRAQVVLGLALSTFATAELFTAGALVPMHADLDVPVDAVGSLVTTYAIVAALALLPTAALSRRVPPRRLLCIGMLTLAVSQAGLALSFDLTSVEVFRAVAAVFHGAVWATVPVAAVALLPQRPGQATAGVFLGGSLGTVLGAPLVAQISQSASWRLAAVLLGLIAAACALGLARWLPDLPPQGPSRTATVSTVSAESRRRVGRWCVAIIPVAAAYVASYTFVTESARGRGISEHLIPLLMLAMGTCGLVATVVAGRNHDRHPVAGMLSTSALLVAGFALNVTPLPLFAIGLVVWASAYAALIVQFQTFVTADSPGWSRTASSIYVLTFQIGIAAGGWLGGRTVGAMSPPTSRAIVSTCLAAVGALIIAHTVHHRRST